jgi:hypothetical protein
MIPQAFQQDRRELTPATNEDFTRFPTGVFFQDHAYPKRIKFDSPHDVT